MSAGVTGIASAFIALVGLALFCVEPAMAEASQGGSMQKRVKFDFEVDFSNGGGIQGQDFRLDIAGDDISDGELADHIVRDMRLLMVGQVRILRKEIIAEKHKRPASPPSVRFVDLSHDIEDGMVTYKGMPAPVIDEFITREASRPRYAAGVEFQIGRILMVANTGTYLDTPFHRYADTQDLSGLDVSRVANLPTVVIRAQGRKSISAEHFAGIDVRGKAVLLHTGWDRHWRTDKYHSDSPYLTGDGADYLVRNGAALVGIDSLNIDDTRDPARPTHSKLLAAGIPIVEHLCNLEQVPDSGAKFFGVPAKVKGMGTFPIRAFALLDGSPRQQ